MVRSAHCPHAATVDDVLHGRRRRRAGCSWAPEVDVESSARQARSVGRSRYGLADAIVTTDRDDVMGHAAHGALRFARGRKRRAPTTTNDASSSSPRHEKRAISTDTPAHAGGGAATNLTLLDVDAGSPEGGPGQSDGTRPGPDAPSTRRPRHRRWLRRALPYAAVVGGALAAGRDAAVRGGRGQRRPGRRARRDAVELGRRHRPRAAPARSGGRRHPRHPAGDRGPCHPARHRAGR